MKSNWKRVKFKIFHYSLFITLAVINVYSLQAQNLNGIPDINPMTPNVATLFKTLDRPIGNSTGTVPVNFPLMSISSGPLTANLSLNYNSTSGIRVEENPSSVGLGFILADGGGVITQQIHGLDDLLGKSYDPSQGLFCENMQAMYNALQQQSDLEPDIFYYSFNGKSGKFLLNKDGTVQSNDNTGIKIIPSGNGWLITDNNGNKYYFGSNQTGSVNYYLENIYTFSSSGSNGTVSKFGTVSKSWYLAEVKDMNDENSLEYSYVTSTGPMTGSSGTYLPVTNTNLITRFNTLPSTGGYSLTSSNEYIVSRIDSKSGYVLINSSTGHVGSWGRLVTSIQCYDPSNYLKKEFHLNYQNSGRLKLDNFSEIAAVGTDSITTRFDYNSEYLPDRLSNFTDFWGYYNGTQNAINLLDPNAYFMYFPSVYFNYGSQIFKYSNRAIRAPTLDAQAEILTKVTYPSGGYREFVYEGNQALQNTNGQHLIDHAFTNHQSFQITSFSGYSSPVPLSTQDFVINSNDGISNFSYVLNGIGAGYCTVKLFSGDGSTLINTFNSPSANTDLLNGQYHMEVYQSQPNTVSLTSIVGSWDESILRTDFITTPYGTYNRNNTNVGGIRIKELRDYDPASNEVNKTEYRYKLYSVDSTYTSGLLITPIQFTHIENPSSYSGSFLAIYTNSYFSLGSLSGAYVIYPEVRTIENGNGWTDQKFSYDPSILAENSILNTPIVDFAYLNGNIEATKVYKQNGALLKKTSYNNSIGVIAAQVGYKFKPYYQTYIPAEPVSNIDQESPNNSFDLPLHADCLAFLTSIGSSLVNYVTDSVYNGTNVLVNRTDYSYFTHSNVPLLRQTRAGINNNEIKIVTYRYAFDDNATFTFGLNSDEQNIKTSMLSKNYLQPIELVDSLKRSDGQVILLGGQKMSMATFNAGSLHPYQVFDYTSASEFRRLNYTSYDSQGNLTEKAKDLAVKEVYLWGYNHTYPVAKIENSDYVTVGGLVNDSVIQNVATTDADMRTELNKIRTGLAGSNAQVTTYTYSPLVGMTSSTDAKGQTTYYEYDGFQRQVNVKDQDGNILKHTDYHYQNQ